MHKCLQYVFYSYKYVPKMHTYHYGHNMYKYRPKYVQYVLVGPKTHYSNWVSIWSVFVRAVRVFILVLGGTGIYVLVRTNTDQILTPFE